MSAALQEHVPSAIVAAGHTVHFRFRLNQEVKITDLKLSGRVLARMDRGNLCEYRVVYWADAKRYDQWLCEHELEG